MCDLWHTVLNFQTVAKTEYWQLSTSELWAVEYWVLLVNYISFSRVQSTPSWHIGRTVSYNIWEGCLNYVWHDVTKLMYPLQMSLETLKSRPSTICNGLRVHVSETVEIKISQIQTSQIINCPGTSLGQWTGLRMYLVWYGNLIIVVRYWSHQTVDYMLAISNRRYLNLYLLNKLKHALSAWYGQLTQSKFTGHLNLLFHMEGTLAAA